MARVKITDLLPGTGYVVQVRARRGELNSKWSEKFEFTAIENSVIPKTPTNVSWVAADKHFDGAWDKVNKQLDEDFAKIIRYDVELENSTGTLREVVPVTATDEAVQKYKLGEQKMQAIFGQILTTVKFRVRAVSQNENKSAWSTQITATIGTPAPPTNAVVEEGIGFVKLTWTPPVNLEHVDGYRVYVGGSYATATTRVYSGTETNYTFNTQDYTKKYFKIVSFSRFGPESTSLNAEGTPGDPDNPAIPVAPTGVTWAANGDAFHGEWNEVTAGTLGQVVKISRYEIEMTGNPGAVISTGSTPSVAGGKQSYDLSFEENVARFLAAKASISIRVRAVSNYGVLGTWSAATAAAVNAPPAAPTGLAGTANTEYIDLKWNAVVELDLVGYNLYLSTTGPTGTYNRIFQGTTLNYSFPSSMYTTDHYFQVKAYDKFGLESAASNTVGPLRPNSAFAVDTTAPSAPTGLAMTIANGADGSPGKGNITWTMASPPTDLAGFTVRWRKVGDTNWQTTSVDRDSRAVEVLLDTPYVNYETQVRAYDWAANYSAWTASATGTASANVAPPTPTSPNASASTMNIQVRPTGTKAAGGGAMDADVTYYEVYASTTSGFTTYDSTTMLGTIPVGPAMVATFPVPASNSSGSTQPWYIKIIAVDSSGAKSPASAQTTASPNLIDTANIVNASITDAKIQDLTVTKLTAGTGLINDFTIKATLTMGTSATNGAIQSWDYSPSSAGYKLDKTSLEINNGSVAASALRIQIGQNILPYGSATMSWPTITDMANLNSGVSSTLSLDTVNVNYMSQSLKASVTAAVSRLLTFSSGVSVNNIIIPELGSEYIASLWVRPTVTNSLSLRSYDGATLLNSIVAKRVSDDSTTLTANVWQRVYAVLPAINVPSINLRLLLPTVVGDWNIDGVQFEQRLAGNTSGKPSTWTPPSTTTIDGSMVKTGQIISSTNTTVGAASVPTWSIPLNGAATFAALNVRGITTLGVSGDSTNSLIKSWNYSGVGGVGWMMDATGNLVANSGTFGGSLNAATGTFSGTLSAATITGTTSISGATLQTGAGTSSVVRIDSTGIKVYGSGSTVVLDAPVSGGLTVTGTINATAGTFSGNITSSATITGGNLYGATVSTSASSTTTRVTLTTSGDIQFYNGSAAAGTINQSAGSLSLSGPSAATMYFRNDGAVHVLGDLYMNSSGTTPTGHIATNTLFVKSDINVSEVRNTNGPLTLTGSVSATGAMTIGGVVTLTSLNNTNGSNYSNNGPAYCRVGASGVLYASTTAPSSRTIKHDIKDLEVDYRTILKLQPKTYRYNEAPETVRVGFIAEEAHDLGLGSWVGYEDHRNPEKPTGFDYDGYVAALQIVAQEQQKQIDELATRLEALGG